MGHFLVGGITIRNIAVWINRTMIILHGPCSMSKAIDWMNSDRPVRKHPAKNSCVCVLVTKILYSRVTCLSEKLSVSLLLKGLFIDICCFTGMFMLTSLKCVNFRNYSVQYRYNSYFLQNIIWFYMLMVPIRFWVFYYITYISFRNCSQLIDDNTFWWSVNKPLHTFKHMR